MLNEQTAGSLNCFVTYGGRSTGRSRHELVNAARHRTGAGPTPVILALERARIDHRGCVETCRLPLLFAALTGRSGHGLVLSRPCAGSIRSASYGDLARCSAALTGTVRLRAFPQAEKLAAQ